MPRNRPRIEPGNAPYLSLLGERTYILYIPMKKNENNGDRSVTRVQIEAGLRELALSHDPYDPVSSLTDSDLAAVYIAMQNALSLPTCDHPLDPLC
jgi:hypothetical protein